jgi:Glycosyltransferase family 87
VLRMVLIAWTSGNAFDLGSVVLVNHALTTHPFHVYAPSSPAYGRWPYPPGFFPVIAATIKIGSWFGISAMKAIRIPLALGDLGVAWVVQALMADRGSSERKRAIATALICLGPPFVVISSVHGQVDSIGILFALLGIMVWTRTDARWRAIAAGALVGVGADMKTVPLLVVLAMIPSRRSWREAVELVVTAVAVPVLSLVPFVISYHHTLKVIQSYRGVPGVGGLSLLVQPRLALSWYSGVRVTQNGAVSWLVTHATGVELLALALTFAVLWWRRLDPIVSAALIYLVVYVVSVSYFLQYVIWVLPFLLVAGYLRSVLALEVAYLIPLTFAYWHELVHRTGITVWGHSAVLGVYVPAMIALWAAALIGAVLLPWRGRQSPPTSSQAVVS